MLSQLNFTTEQFLIKIIDYLNLNGPVMSVTPKFLSPLNPFQIKGDAVKPREITGTYQ